MPYWRLFYHVVWGTKGREPLILDLFESSLHRRISEKATQLGSIVHAVNGIEDHVHLVVSVPPTVALSELVGQVKGSSSHFVNREFNPLFAFAWQAEYGVVSFGQKQLTTVVEYVNKQEEHHAGQTVIPQLERMAPEDG